mmetsp:Transcript_106870/g.299258  ORF Transcript_106870/g.299258 Transcript_106870/m.299258 type:complete len:111 (-) Transcript_106870:181-513(-)
MSDFVHPRHGMIQEMMLKEQKWVATFIRRQREDEAEKKALALKDAAKTSRREALAENTIRSYLARPITGGGRGAGPAGRESPAAGSLRSSRSTGSLARAAIDAASASCGH